MDLINQRTGTLRNDNLRYVAMGLAIVSALALGIVLGWAVTTMSASSVARPAAVQGDPLAQPATVDFRNSEHAAPVAAVQADPLGQPVTIDFRNSEHAAPVAVVQT